MNICLVDFLYIDVTKNVIVDFISTVVAVLPFFFSPPFLFILRPFTHFEQNKHFIEKKGLLPWNLCFLA